MMTPRVMSRYLVMKEINDDVLVLFADGESPLLGLTTFICPRDIFLLRLLYYTNLFTNYHFHSFIVYQTQTNINKSEQAFAFKYMPA